MLITTCAHCKSRFRVTPEQLNLRQGQVRCGRCEQVFNGFEALERMPDDDTGTRLLAAHGGIGLEPPLGKIPPVTLEDPPSASATVTEEVPPLAPSPPPPPANATREPPAKPPELPTPAMHSLYTYAEPEEPRAAVSRAWSLGVVLLALVLAIQALYAFRSRIAQQYPDVRPVLESACARVGCTVPFVNDEAALKLEDSELLEVPGRPGQIALTARIRNMSRLAQEFPHLELALTDLTGQTAVRRVLRPADYLGRPPVPGEAMAPGSEAQVSLRLETAKVKPTGYELLLFYP